MGIRSRAGNVTPIKVRRPPPPKVVEKIPPPDDEPEADPAFILEKIIALSQAEPAGGVKIHIWPTDRGFQINVETQKHSGWTCETSTDVGRSLQRALRHKTRMLGIGRVD